MAANESRQVSVRLFDRLFSIANPDSDRDGGDYRDHLNADSLEVRSDCRVEPSVGEAGSGAVFRFERLGYFIADRIDSAPGKPVFNRTVTLRDSWAKLEKAELAKLQ